MPVLDRRSLDKKYSVGIYGIKVGGHAKHQCRENSPSPDFYFGGTGKTSCSGSSQDDIAHTSQDRVARPPFSIMASKNATGRLVEALNQLQRVERAAEEELAAVNLARSADLDAIKERTRQIGLALADEAISDDALYKLTRPYGNLLAPSSCLTLSLSHVSHALPNLS